MNVFLTLKEGGLWWNVTIPNVDMLKQILNSGEYNETRIHSLMMHLRDTQIIYDFSIRQWR